MTGWEVGMDEFDRFDVQLQRGGLVPGEFLAIADDVGFRGTDDGRGIG